MALMSYAMSDSWTMVRRNVRHITRYPSMLLATVVIPALMFLLFVFAFGGVMGKGLVGKDAGTDYVDYLSPGIILLALVMAAMSTSVSVAMDMTKGIINRFRTMAIARTSVLVGHVVGSVVQALVSVVIMLAVALVAGFRPSAGIGGWLAALGLVALLSFALTWIAVAFGLAAKTVESASNTPMLLQLLPFLSSAFVPAESMASGLRWFTEYQPFTPIADTLRGLFLGRPIGNDWIIAIAWCLGIALVGYLWSARLFKRDPQMT
ncbi:ABC transporter permease [Streptomyces natalensis]|uniref:Transport permease protein n=1 Tax=Streptomyces natalensis ATCC 27448 TaxID=1240678 RepID=A0A0D7CFB0_9ACTN|nr:ABC transporter permease [Streptomyces natalensis]KIZ14873.1 ABC transporter permease [Streptomyces natalensis ATCC 27448]